MRFYLETQHSYEVPEAAKLPWVAGVFALEDREQFRRTAWDIVEEAVRVGRRDWKLFLPVLTSSPYLAKTAIAMDKRLGGLTGGPLAGPTLVYLVGHSAGSLLDASLLMQRSMEVCVTCVETLSCALAVSSIPKLTSPERKPRRRAETEGPPASRTPWAPHYVELFDEGTLVSDVAKLYSHYGVRTRLLVRRVRDHEQLDAISRAVGAAGGSCLVDVTMDRYNIERLSA